MKTVATVLMISASMLAGAVQAAEPEVYPAEVSQPYTLSRAEVVAELHAAQAAGLIAQGQLPNYPTVVVHDTKTRAQVQAELAAAIKSGEKFQVHEPFYPSKVASISSESRS